MNDLASVKDQLAIDIQRFEGSDPECAALLKKINNTLDEDFAEGLAAQRAKAEKLRADLSEALVAPLEALEKYWQGKEAIEAYSSEHIPTIYAEKFINSFLTQWLKNLCKARAESVDARFSISPDDFDADGLTRLSVDRYLKDIGDIGSFVNKLLSNYPFARLISELDKQCSSLVSDGLADAADSLAFELGFSGRWSCQDNTLLVRRQKGRFLLDFSHYGSWSHDRISNLENLYYSVSVFERQEQLLGFQQCINECVELERGTGYNERIASRTRVDGGDVVATFFKEKIIFSLTAEYFEVLLSFIKEHATRDLCEVVVK
jgi:hypothetical protein